MTNIQLPALAASMPEACELAKIYFGSTARCSGMQDGKAYFVKASEAIGYPSNWTATTQLVITFA